MKVRDSLRRSAVAVTPEQTVRVAAEVMRSAGVGALVVVEDDRPIGIVTDRDLVTRSVAEGGPIDARVDSVMSAPLVTIGADEDLRRSFAMFRTHGVRRLVVVDGDTFAGTVSIDDLLIDLAGDLGDLARPVTAETIFGHHDAVVPAMP